MSIKILIICLNETKLDHLLDETYKELVKTNNQWNLELSACNIERDINFQKMQNLWVAKALMCSILSFQTEVTEKLFKENLRYCVCASLLRRILRVIGARTKSKSGSAMRTYVDFHFFYSWYWSNHWVNVQCGQMVDGHLKTHTEETDSIFATWKLWVWNLESISEVLRQVIQVLKPGNNERNNKL